MAQETLNIVITADNKDAINNINQTVQATNSLGTAMGKVPQAAGQANQALINSGRVLQDLNYGFVGIANNLNPLLESFQRLGARAEETGSSVKKELISALTGPAGIGVALSALTFIVLKFGDDIGAMINKLTGGTNSISEFADSLHNSQKAFVNAYEDMYKLGKAFDDFHAGLLSKKQILAEYNSTLGDTYGRTNDVAEAEKVWAANSENFIKSAVLRAAALLQIEKAAKIAAQAFEVAQQPAAQSTSLMTSISAGTLYQYGGTTNDRVLAQQQKQDQADKIAGIKKEEEFHLNVAKAIQKEIDGLKETATYTKFIGKDLPKEGAEDAFTKATKERIAANQTNLELLRSGAKTQEQYFIDAARISETYYNKIKDINTKIAIETAKMFAPIQFEKADKDIIDLEAKFREQDSSKSTPLISQSFGFTPQNKAAFKAGKDILDDFFKDSKKTLKENDLALKESENQYKNFAKTLSGDVTNGLMGLFEALEQGKNPLQSIGDMFANIAKQIAAMVIEATIFEAIMTAFPELKGAFAAIGVVSKVVPHAEGGITTGPHIGLVGEAGPEAIMPLSKLGSMIKTTFNAGAMSGNGGASGGQFVLRGQDLLLSVNRAQKAGNIKGQSISLA